jgi:hypothetical protein
MWVLTQRIKRWTEGCCVRTSAQQETRRLMCVYF